MARLADGRTTDFVTFELDRKTNMSTEVRISYELTLEESQLAHRVWKRVSSFKGKSWFGTIFFWCMSFAYCGMVVGAVWHSWRSERIDGDLLCLALTPLILWMAWARLASARNAKNPDLNHPVRYTISSDRWIIESHTSHTEFLWSPVKSITQVAEGFFVIFHDRGFQWLPIHGFESGAAVESFLRMIESHDVKYEDRRRA